MPFLFVPRHAMCPFDKLYGILEAECALGILHIVGLQQVVELFHLFIIFHVYGAPLETLRQLIRGLLDVTRCEVLDLSILLIFL
jgi:hypothetical protein